MSFLSHLGGTLVGGALGGGAGLLEGGAYDLYQSNSKNGAPSSVDPFGPYRQGFVSQLNQLMSGSYDLSSNPAYKAEIAQGAQTVNRQAAAAGSFDSGNRLTALTASGAQIADQTYQQQFQLLNLLSGNSGFNAQTMAHIAGAQQQQKAGIAGDVGSLLGAISGGLL